MRILRIGLKNLTSLRGEHSVDLENGPLSEAGIFAITGPTGAGKSTLLDAVTLALYGRAARYGRTPNPADMMSRHTGMCSAEVEFEVPKGRFRAEWQLNRARKDPEGKLQPAKRFIYDASGLPLTQKLKDVDVLLEDLIGLDYERFLRSVLLAQGDFARFLKASANERSELLESLTGTQVYSQLSVLCHEETTRKEEAFRVREEALGSIRLLEDELRSALVKEDKALAKSLVLDRKKLDVLREEIERGKRLAYALEKQRKIQETVASVKVELRKNGDDFSRLKTHRAALVFQPMLTKVYESETLIGELGVTVKASKDEVVRSRVELRSMLEAAKLSAEAKGAASVKEVEVGTAAVRSLEEELDANKRWQSKHAADQDLSERLPVIAEAFAEVGAQRREWVKLKGQAGGLKEEEKTTLSKMEALAKEQEQMGETLKQSEGGFKLAKDSLIALLEGKELEKLREALNQLRTQQEALARLEKLRKQVLPLKAQVDRLAPDHVKAVELLKVKRELVESLRESLETARLIATFEEHRHQLEDGDECPLCGALEHPFSDPEKRPPVKGERLKKAQQELAEMEKNERELATSLAKERETLRLLEGNIQEAEKELSNAPKGLGAEIERLSGRIKTAEGHEKEAARLEKAVIEQRGKFEKLKETAKAGEERVSKVVSEEKRMKEEMDRITKTSSQLVAGISAKLEPFGVTFPESGKEEAAKASLSERGREWRKREEEAHQLTAKISATKSMIEKNQERAKMYRDLAEGYLGSVRNEKLENVSLLDPVPGTENPETDLARCRDARSKAEARFSERLESLEKAKAFLQSSESSLLEQLKDSSFSGVDALRAAILKNAEAAGIEALEKDIHARQLELSGQQKQIDEDLSILRKEMAPQGELLEDKEEAHKQLQDLVESNSARGAKVRADLEHDNYQRKMQAEQVKVLDDHRRSLTRWLRLRELIGSHDGRKFRTFAQGLSLDVLLRHANRHLAKLADRYELRRVEDGALQLEIVDLHQANARRPMESLSGGESFLASLALALGLSDLAGRNVRIDSLFIDEGFGSLDPETLDVAVAALESLRTGSKMIGVISHVELLKERIGAQLRVQPGPGGISRIEASL